MKGTIVFTSLALGAAAFHPFVGGFAPFFLLIPLFWLIVIGLVVTFAVRGRRRFWANAGYGAMGYGPWVDNAASRGAESVLAQRFANGDIDEKEYRARLEVLRASSPLPPRK